MCECRAGALDLAALCRSAQLPCQFDDLTQSGCAQRFAFRKESSAGVDGQAPIPLAVAIANEGGDLVGGAEAQLLDRENLATRVGVLHFGQIEVGGAESRLREGLLGRELRGAGRLGVDTSAHRRVLAEGTAREMGSDDGGEQADGGSLRPRFGTQDDTRSPLVRRAEHEEG